NGSRRSYGFRAVRAAGGRRRGRSTGSSGCQDGGFRRRGRSGSNSLFRRGARVRRARAASARLAALAGCAVRDVGLSTLWRRFGASSSSSSSEGENIPAILAVTAANGLVVAALLGSASVAERDEPTTQRATPISSTAPDVTSISGKRSISGETQLMTTSLRPLSLAPWKR